MIFTLKRMVELYTIINRHLVDTLLGTMSVLERITFKCMENFLFQWSMGKVLCTILIKWDCLLRIKCIIYHIQSLD